MTTPATLTVMTPLEIRNGYLRSARAGLIKRGVANPNVTDKSDYAVRAEALANAIAPAMANSVIAADANMPDTAVGERLQRWLTMFSIPFRPAQGSTGSIVHSASASGYVPLNAQLVDSAGLFFKVTTGGTYANGALIPITAISTGKASNHEAGDVLQWVSPPPYANSKVVVATGGLIDGADADTEEIARGRLLDRLKNPVGGGNWQQTVQWAEDASAAVLAAFDYPALRGPSSYGIWVLGALRWDAANAVFSRQLSDALRTTIGSYVRAKKPTETALWMPSTGAPPYTVADVPTDVAFGLSLPAAAAAGGPGGGWTDPAPWPLLGTESVVLVDAGASITPTSFRLTSPLGTAPLAAGVVDGTTQIAVFDPIAWWNSGNPDAGTAIRSSTVVSHSGTDGAVVVTIDPAHPFPNVEAGTIVFPNAEHAEQYAQAVMAAFEDMGPGEWTADPVILPSAMRRPLPAQEHPYALSGAMLRAITNAGDEVLDVQYITGSRTYLLPPVPAAVTFPPGVLVPRRFGFYPLS